nr:hypothetical protein [Tanacetum cinerariifolium]GEW73507.1 hypothetical protein [Tanacetum cinerariifolium]
MHTTSWYNFSGQQETNAGSLTFQNSRYAFTTVRYDLIFKGGRLFQQYIVGVFCVIEQNQLDFLRKKQNDIRADYLFGIYDAISQGERDGYEVGGRIILPMSFTSGPRYMYAHYLEALAICQNLGNLQFFITFTCDVNWPEIKRFMAQYPELTASDRADVVCQVFEQKIQYFVTFLKEERIFGYVTGDPDGYNIVSETMMHCPYGAANFNASCMKGLLGDDGEWETALEEACVSATSEQLRFVFSHILLHCDVENLNNRSSGYNSISRMNALWEVIEFGDSYKAPLEESGIANTNSGKGEINTASVPTASTQVSLLVLMLQLPWNTALLSMRDDIFWKKTGKKITIQGTDVAGFNKSKVECFNFHKMGHLARECRAPRSQDRKENHALVVDDEDPTEFALMAKSSSSFENEVFDDSLCSKSCKKNTDSLNTKITNLNEALSDTDCAKVKTNKAKAARKPSIKYAEMYRNTSKSPKGKAVKASACWIWRPKQNTTDKGPNSNSVSVIFKKYQYIDTQGNSQNNIDDKGYWDSGCSRHMTGNISYLSDYEPYDGGYVSFGQGGGKITGKARTMLADAKLPVTFWAEAVNTACYVQNRVLVNKSQNKTPYELFNSRAPAIEFLRPFGCHVMILNILDHLGKFDAKGDEGYFVGYSMSSKAFRVFNKRTKKVEENLHVDFLENKLIEKGAGPNWLFDIDTLTNSMNYVPVVVVGTSSTNFSAHMESSTSNAQDSCNAAAPKSSGNSNPTGTSKKSPADQMETLTVETLIPIVSSPVLTAYLDDSPKTSSDTRLISKRVNLQEESPSLDNILTLLNRFEDILGGTTNIVDTDRVEADLSNMETSITASPTPTFRIHKDYPKSQIIGPMDTSVQTRHKSKEMEEQSFIATIHQKTNPELLQFCLFSCFLSQEEPKKIFDALKKPKLGVRPIGTKWVLKNKKDKRGIVIRNKARLVVQGHTQEEGIDYEEVFAPVVRIETIRLFLAYASLMGFTVYQMDVKSTFLYGTINEEVYVMQPPGFQDPEFPDRVYKGKDGTGKDIELHLYRSMIGSLMYLTASRPDIMFVVFSCARHQVTAKECHLHAVKRIFRYVKGHPKLGLWYPKESPFDLVAYSDSDYGGATQDRKSTTGGCQFLRRRLISWQCKKQKLWPLPQLRQNM